MTSLVLLLAVLLSANANLVHSQLLAVPNDEFLERLRNWQIALQASQDVQSSIAPVPEIRDVKYGLPPPVGPIQVPLPPTYPNQPGGYYPPSGYPGQQPSVVYPPTPPPLISPRPTRPTERPQTPPPTKLPPTDNPLSKYCLKPRGQFPSKTCNKYVNCWDDVVVEQECPSGLVFSEKGYCDYDYNVDCSRRPQNVTESPVTMPPSHGGHGGKCPTLYGYYRDSKNCSIFYICVAGEAIKFECPPTLVFNTEHGVCDYPYNVPSCPKAYYPPDVPPPVVDPPSHPTVPPFPPSYPTHPPSYPPNPPSYPPHPPSYFPPPSYHPGIYNPYAAKKVPAGFVNAQNTCIEGTVVRLDPTCSQVSLCRNGKTEVINCGYEHAYDQVQDICVEKHLARC